MRKILLVNTNVEKFPYPIPPLGICLLGSYLKPWYEVMIYDGMFDEGRSLTDLVKDFGPDYIGISIRNIDDVVADKEVFYVEQILQDFIRPVQTVSQAPLILGGSGFSVFPLELMELTGADYGIVGEGEEALFRLLKNLDSGNMGVSLPQVIGQDDRFATPPVPAEFISYRSLPFSVIDQHIDFSPYLQRGVYSIQTKRGCALQCIYCTYPGIEGRCYRMRDPDMIAREMVEVIDRIGDVIFEFVDSTFNEPEGQAEAICSAILKRGIRPRLRTMGVNPGNTSRKLFDLMMEAGFMQIDVTPDSASPPVIRKLKKGFTIADIRRTADLIREFNLPTMWFFLFGGPGETDATVRETCDFIREYISEDDLVLMYSGLRIYPNTPLEQIALREGRIRQGESLLHPSPFYYSPRTPKENLDQWLREIRDSSYNCLFGAESVPTPGMLRKAMDIREAEKLTEPMFRTLLRIRKDEGRGT